MPVTFLASAKAFSFGLGGGDSSKKRTSSPSEMPLPSLGICVVGVPFILGIQPPLVEIDKAAAEKRMAQLGS